MAGNGMTSAKAVATRGRVAGTKVAAKARVTAKVRQAIELMVRDGLKRAAAAEAVGLTDNALYISFRKPETKKVYRQELMQLRESEQARSVHRLIELRDQDDNLMAALKASQTLLDEEISTNKHQQLPGVVVVISDSVNPRPTIDLTANKQEPDTDIP